jgi:hypothetical protein
VSHQHPAYSPSLTEISRDLFFLFLLLFPKMSLTKSKSLYVANYLRSMWEFTFTMPSIVFCFVRTAKAGKLLGSGDASRLCLLSVWDYRRV